MYKRMPVFNYQADRTFSIPSPGSQGLDLFDAEYQMDAGFSPYMRNIMYREGHMSKRYGQETFYRYTGSYHKVYCIGEYDGFLTAHIDGYIYFFKDGEMYQCSGTVTPVNAPTDIPLYKFFKFQQKFYYYMPGGFYVYNPPTGTDTVGSWSTANFYVPEITYNGAPDGSYYDKGDDYNIINPHFTMFYHGDGTSTVYHINSSIPAEYVDSVEVDGTAVTGYTFNYNAQTVTFSSAPAAGTQNVSITCTYDYEEYLNDLYGDILFDSRYMATYGGGNDSRLFTSTGNSKVYYSHSYDCTYFPENNFFYVGASEEPITGFGKQYNTLFVFKPRETYSISSYTQTTATTLIEEDVGLEGFRLQIVNSAIGCTAGDSIQVINNLLTWYSKYEGICTLVSTQIADERNIRVLSRNIEHTNNYGIPGILDSPLKDDTSICSADYDHKYFLIFPTSGACYIWDYGRAGFGSSAYRGYTDPKDLAWYYCEGIYARKTVNTGSDLYYLSDYTDDEVDFTKQILHFTDELHDSYIDTNGDSITRNIASCYMTPFIQFGTVEYLKTVNKIYIQIYGRGRVNTVDMKWYTDGNYDLDDNGGVDIIRLSRRLWGGFQWSEFVWTYSPVGKTYFRRINQRHVQMMSFLFENEDDYDMPLTHIILQYQIEKQLR